MAKRNRTKEKAQAIVNMGKLTEGIPKDVPLNVISNEALQNGLSDALGFNQSLGFPQNQGAPFVEQVSNVNTLFKNLRWYLVSNFRQLLCQAYVEIGLVGTIVDVPIDDGLRGGIEIKSKQLDEDQIEELKTSIDRDNDLEVAGDAGKWNRLFGGAGIIIITDQDPETPLDIAAIDKDSPLEFRAVDMWELFWDQQNTEGYDPEIQSTDFEFYNYYAIKLHKSRVMKLQGLKAPSFIRPRLRGWGFSCVERLVRSINQYLKGTDLGFEVLDEFKLDVYKLKNLADTLMSPQGEAKVKQRVQMTNWQKNYQNAIVMDSEDEFDHKQLSFAGLAEAMTGIRLQVAADMRMPLTKLFGQSATGFNSGEDDIEVYNSMVESQVRNKLKYDILRMIEIKCQKLFGFIPDDLVLSFKPLRVLSAVQEEEVKTSKFNRLMTAREKGEITRFEFREGCNKDNLLSISLDTKGDSLNPDDPEVAELLEGNPDPENPDDPGANRSDSRQPQLADKKKEPEHDQAKQKQKGKKVETPDEDEDKRRKRTTMGEPVNVEPINKEPKNREPKQNSIQFDVAAYEADGGDSQFLDGKREFFENPYVDETLWQKAKESSEKAFGRVKWKFVVWWYKNRGGKFNDKY
jgi:phage-related protein (TIGR01555 family)